MKTEEILEALKLLEKERGISVEYMLDKISRAIATACKNSYGGNEDVVTDIDPKSGKFDVFIRKEVVEEVFEPGFEIGLSEARKIDPTVAVGEKVSIQLSTKEFGRIAAQTARNIIRQGIRDVERSNLLKDFEGKQQQVVSAKVDRIDPKTGGITVKIGKTNAFLPKQEQLPGDNFYEGQHVNVYLVDVKEGDKGPRVLISRTHADMIKRLLEREVPEVADGTIEVKNVAREAGSRTKVAVFSTNEDVDAVGSCIGARGARINAIVEELGGEKIDVVPFSENSGEFVASALLPAQVLEVTIDPDAPKVCRAVVPDDQLSLAIGNKGQNARLAARLTGWRIDIRPESAS